VAVLVRRRTRNVSLLVVVWVLIGIVVAAERGYITASLLRVLVSAVLAILLWPLVLLGINLHV
jgi:predicted PurR-regulated permease PerM